MAFEIAKGRTEVIGHRLQIHGLASQHLQSP